MREILEIALMVWHSPKERKSHFSHNQLVHNIMDSPINVINIPRRGSARPCRCGLWTYVYVSSTPAPSALLSSHKNHSLSLVHQTPTKSEKDVTAQPSNAGLHGCPIRYCRRALTTPIGRAQPPQSGRLHHLVSAQLAAARCASARSNVQDPRSAVHLL